MAIEKEKTFEQKKYEFEQKFNLLMFELNMFNKSNKTFKLNIIYETNYGFQAQIYNVVGLSLQELNNKKGIVQENLRCLWIMDIEPFEDLANVKIVIEKVDESVEYADPKIKPWEMYLGLDFSLNVIKNNVNNYCMFLLAGATGSGKTFFLNMVMLSWILNCSMHEVELYIADIAKNEFIGFQNVKHVKYYAYELEQLHEMLLLVKKKIESRKKAIAKLREDGIATNIVEYNETQQEKLSYCYIFIDEFSVIMIDKSDNKHEKEIKQEILDIIKYISKIGRSLGVFCFISTQKTVKDEIPSIIKNMSAVRISFRANDSISSEVIMGDSGAMGLANRIAVYSLNGGEKKDFLFSPTLKTKTLNSLLQPYIVSYSQNDVVFVSDADRLIPAQSFFEIKICGKSKTAFKGGAYLDY